jgi:hypothetical protein
VPTFLHDDVFPWLSQLETVRLRGLLRRILADFSTSMQATPQFPAADSPEPLAPAPVAAVVADTVPPSRLREVGGPAGPEPTRYGDWERKGRCIDF